MTDKQLNEGLRNLDTELQNVKQERAGGLRKRLDWFINGDPDNDDWNGLHGELLEAEAQYIESHPRLAAALRSMVAIIENAGL